MISECFNPSCRKKLKYLRGMGGWFASSMRNHPGSESNISGSAAHVICHIEIDASQLLRRHSIQPRVKVGNGPAPHPNGLVRAWLNGKQLVGYIGITANRPTATGYPDPATFHSKWASIETLCPSP
jgi:hypothetical protein